MKIESHDKLKEIDIKNRTCYYFDDIIEIEDFDLENILIDKKSYKNFSVYNISYKGFIDSKPLHIRFDRVDGFIKVYNGTRYLVLFGSEKCDSICDRIRHLISVKSGITYILSRNYATTKVDSLPIEKTMTLCNVMILV